MPAERALLLAAIAEGESGVLRALGALRVVQLLRSLGINVATERDAFIVQGNGLRGLSPAEEIIDLRGWGASGLLVIAVLVRQSFYNSSEDRETGRLGRALALYLGRYGHGRTARE